MPLTIRRRRHRGYFRLDRIACVFPQASCLQAKTPSPEDMYDGGSLSSPYRVPTRRRLARGEFRKPSEQQPDAEGVNTV